LSPYLRQVKTASGATAVQVVAKDHGVRRIVEHLGSAHDEAELAALMRLGRQRLPARPPGRRAGRRPRPRLFLVSSLSMSRGALLIKD